MRQPNRRALQFSHPLGQGMTRLFRIRLHQAPLHPRHVAARLTIQKSVFHLSARPKRPCVQEMFKRRAAILRAEVHIHQPCPERIRHIRNEPHRVRLHLLHRAARHVRLPQHRAVRVVANRRRASFQQKLLPRHP